MALEPGMDEYRRWVGGNWPEVQKWQYEFLQNRMYHYNESTTFLDVGCGSLRLGSRLIREHDADKYIGLDVSQELIDFGLKYEIRDKDLEAKRPRFIVNSDFDLTSLGDEKVDIAWCFSLWMHIPDWLMKQALTNIKSVLAHDGVIWSSFSEDYGISPLHGETPDDYVYDRHQRTFVRYRDELEKIFDECGLTFEERDPSIKSGYMVRSVPKDR
jgi:SAM-dependent methyltransferase